MLQISTTNQVKLEYRSRSEEGPLVWQDFVIKVSIAAYDSIEPAYVEIRLNYRECALIDEHLYTTYYLRSGPINISLIGKGQKDQELSECSSESDYTYTV